MPRRRSAIPGRDGPAPEHYAPYSMFPSTWSGYQRGGYTCKKVPMNMHSGYESGGDNSQRIRSLHSLNAMRECGTRRRPRGQFGFPPWAGYHRAPWGLRERGGFHPHQFHSAQYGTRVQPLAPFLRNQAPMRPYAGPYSLRPSPFRFGHHAVRNRYNHHPMGRGGMGFGIGVGTNPLGGMGGAFRGLGPRGRPPIISRLRSYMDDDQDFDELGDDSSYMSLSYDRYGSSHPSSVVEGDISDYDDDEISDENDDEYYDEGGSMFGGRHNRYGGHGRGFL